MKIVLQQYKLSAYQRFLGLGALAVFIADVVLILWYYFWPVSAPYLYFGYAVYTMVPCFCLWAALLPVSKMVVDLTSKTYYNRRSLGFFTLVTKRRPLPKADYISVFSQLHADTDSDGDVSESYTYDVNLWYDGNRHITLCTQYFDQDALEVGQKLATALQCDLLDATDPEDKVWIEYPKQTEVPATN